MRQNSNILPFVSFFLCLLLLGICFQITKKMEPYEVIKTDTITTTKTDTLWKDTTITKTDTKVKYIQVVKTDTVYDKQGNEIELITDNKTYSDTILCGMDTIDYQIHISGIKSRLDSVSLRLKKSEVIKTNTVTVEKYIKEQKKLWDRIHLQPQATFGYDPINKNWGAVIGLGVGIDI